MQTLSLTTLDQLSEIMYQVHSGSTAAIQAESETFFQWCTQGMESDPEKFLSILYLKALNNKLRSDMIYQNHYEKKYEVSQIALFDILIHQFPYVKYGQDLVNKAILNLLQQHECINLVDIGCGLGTQMIHIIEQAATIPTLKKLTIVGIEPFPDALAQAQQFICKAAEQKHFEFEFIGIQAYIEEVDFNALFNKEGKFIVNASLALHHIQHKVQRVQTISAIKALQPIAFFLTEPNSDHTTHDFMKRFENSYRHFLSLFKVIDQLPIEKQYQHGLKLFFGREIEDIIGKPDSERFEQHASVGDWIAMLTDAGIMLSTSFLDQAFIAEPGVEIAPQPEGYVGFTYEDETALTIMMAH